MSWTYECLQRANHACLPALCKAARTERLPTRTSIHCTHGLLARLTRHVRRYSDHTQDSQNTRRRAGATYAITPEHRHHCSYLTVSKSMLTAATLTPNNAAELSLDFARPPTYKHPDDSADLTRRVCRLPRTAAIQVKSK